MDDSVINNSIQATQLKTEHAVATLAALNAFLFHKKGYRDCLLCQKGVYSFTQWRPKEPVQTERQVSSFK